MNLSSCENPQPGEIFLIGDCDYLHMRPAINNQNNSMTMPIILFMIGIGLITFNLLSKK